MKRPRVNEPTYWIGGLLGLSLAAFMLTRVHPGEVLATLRQTRPLYVLIGLMLYLSVCVLRNLRFWLLFSQKVPFLDMLRIVVIQNTLNSTLPARAGEAAYIYLLDRSRRVPLGTNAAALVMVRALDLIGMSVLFIAATRAAERLSPVATRLTAACGIIMALAALGIVGIALLGQAALSRAETALARRGWAGRRLVDKGLRFARQFLDGFEALRSRRMAGPVLLVTVLINLSMHAVGYVLIRGMGIDLTVWQAIIGGTVALLATLSPLQGFLGLGTTELGWAFGFALVGLSQQESITSGFAYHSIMLIYVAFLGLGAWGSLRWQGRAKAPAGAE